MIQCFSQYQECEILLNMIYVNSLLSSSGLVCVISKCAFINHQAGTGEEFICFVVVVSVDTYFMFKLKVFCFVFVFSAAVLEKYSDDAVSHDGSAAGLHSLPDFPHEFHVPFVQLLRVSGHPKCVAGHMVCAWP